MPYTWYKCGSEVIIKIISMKIVAKDNLYCPICGGDLKPHSIGNAVVGE